MDRTGRNKDKPSRTESQQNPPSRLTSRRGLRNQVYFVRCGDFVKIGYASHVPTRFSGIKTSTPHEVVLLGTIPGTLATEAAFHERFKRHHHRGEWFRLVDDIERALNQIGIYLRPLNKSEVSAILNDPYMEGIARHIASRAHLEEIGRRNRRMIRAAAKRGLRDLENSK